MSSHMAQIWENIPKPWPLVSYFNCFIFFHTHSNPFHFPSWPPSRFWSLSLFAFSLISYPPLPHTPSLNIEHSQFQSNRFMQHKPLKCNCSSQAVSEKQYYLLFYALKCLLFQSYIKWWIFFLIKINLKLSAYINNISPEL